MKAVSYLALGGINIIGAYQSTDSIYVGLLVLKLVCNTS